MSAREGLDRGDGGGPEETDEEIDRRARRRSHDGSDEPSGIGSELVGNDDDDDDTGSGSGSSDRERATGSVGPNTGLDSGDGGGPDPVGGSSGRDETTTAEPPDPRSDATGAGSGGQLRSGGPNDATDSGGDGPTPTTPPESETQRPDAPTNPNVGLDRGDGGGPDTDPGPRVDPDRTPVPEETDPRRQIRGGFGAPTRGANRGSARPGERFGDSFITVNGERVEPQLENAAREVEAANRITAEQVVDRQARGGGPTSGPVLSALGRSVAVERAALGAAETAGFEREAEAVRGVTPGSQGPVETTADSFVAGGLSLANIPAAVVGGIEAAEFARNVNRRVLTDRGELVAAGAGAAAGGGTVAGVSAATEAATQDGPLVDDEGTESVSEDIGAAVAERVAAAEAAPFRTGGQLAGAAAAGAGVGLVGGAGISAAARATRLPDVPNVSRRAGRAAINRARDFRDDTRGQVSAGRQRRSGSDSDSSSDSSDDAAGDLEGVTGRDPTDTFGTRGRAVGGRRAGEPSVGTGRARTTDLERQSFGEAARRGGNVPDDDLRRLVDVERDLGDATDPEDLDRRRTPPGADEDTSLPDANERDDAFFSQLRERDRAAGGAAGGLGPGVRGTGSDDDSTTTNLPRGDEVARTVTGPATDAQTDAGTNLNTPPRFRDLANSRIGTRPRSGTGPRQTTFTDQPNDTDTITSTQPAASDPDPDPFFRSPIRTDDDGRRPDEDAGRPSLAGGSGPAVGGAGGFDRSRTFATGFATGDEIFDSVFGDDN